MTKTCWLTGWSANQSGIIGLCSKCITSYEVKDFEYDLRSIYVCDICCKNTAKYRSLVEDAIIPVGVYDD